MLPGLDPHPLEDHVTAKLTDDIFDKVEISHTHTAGCNDNITLLQRIGDRTGNTLFVVFDTPKLHRQTAILFDNRFNYIVVRRAYLRIIGLYFSKIKQFRTGREYGNYWLFIHCYMDNIQTCQHTNMRKINLGTCVDQGLSLSIVLSYLAHGKPLWYLFLDNDLFAINFHIFNRNKRISPLWHQRSCKGFDASSANHLVTQCRACRVDTGNFQPSHCLVFMNDRIPVHCRGREFRRIVVCHNIFGKHIAYRFHNVESFCFVISNLQRINKRHRFIKMHHDEIFLFN